MPDDVKTASRYKQDFAAWAYEQADALRAARDALARRIHDKTLDALDWDNLVEEIEGLAQRDRRELESRIALIVEHLAKLQHSPARDPRAGWTATVGRSRLDMQAVLEDSPSLRREVPVIVAKVAASAIQVAARSLTENGEEEAASAVRQAPGYTPDQILGDWWPQ